MTWAKPHGAPGGPGKLLSERGAAALSQPCPTCDAKPGERCIRVHDGGYSFKTDGKRLGRAHFETRPSQSHKARLPGYRPTHCRSCTCWEGA